jgi:hypothetical protein
MLIVLLILLTISIGINVVLVLAGNNFSDDYHTTKQLLRSKCKQNEILQGDLSVMEMRLQDSQAEVDRLKNGDPNAVGV